MDTHKRVACNNNDNNMTLMSETDIRREAAKAKTNRDKEPRLSGKWLYYNGLRHAYCKVLDDYECEECK